MQTYKIENNSPRGKAFKVFGGVEEVKAGETRTLDLEYELAVEQIEAIQSLATSTNEASYASRIPLLRPGIDIDRVDATICPNHKRRGANQNRCLGNRFADGQSPNQLSATLKETIDKTP